MTDREKAQLMVRLAEIDAKIADAKHWGALLTALNEERIKIRRKLGLDQ